MPFIAKKLERRTKPLPSKIDMAITGLQQARAEAEKQAGWLQDLVFDDWIRRCVVEVDDPRDWTQARVLYEDYLVHARTFGNKGNEKRVVRKRSPSGVVATQRALRYPSATALFRSAASTAWA